MYHTNSNYFKTHDRYLFQGQEMDNEVKGDGNSVNYKYRMHDSRLGRFFAIDPMSNTFPFYSPYAFSGNRLIDKIEMEGLQPADFEKQKVAIIGNIKKNNVITRTDQQYILDGIKERGYALHSEIVFFTQKPYSSSWSRSQAKTNKDKGLNVRSDEHHNAQIEAEKRALKGLPAVTEDAPGPYQIYIPGKDLLPLVDEYPIDEIDFEKEKGFSWLINPNEVTSEGITDNNLTNINLAIHYAIKLNKEIVIYGGKGDNAESINQMILEKATASGIDPSKIRMATTGGGMAGIKVVGIGVEDNKTIE
jgi:RHS repeat-associated protein